MLPELFASKPAESQRLYAESIEEEGEFDDAVAGWRQARTDWVEGLGRRKLPTFTVGPVIVEATDAEIEQFAADATAIYRAAGSDRVVTADEVRSEIDRKRQALNYNSWKANAELEQKPEVVEARKLVYEGKQAFVSDEPGAQKTPPAENPGRPGPLGGGPAGFADERVRRPAGGPAGRPPVLPRRPAGTAPASRT